MSAQPHSFCKYRKSAQIRPHCFLHVGIRNIHQIRMVDLNVCARRLLPANMLERWPHVCCVKITFELLPTSWFDSTQSTRNSMKCPVNWILVRICVCSTGREVLHPTIKNLISSRFEPCGGANSFCYLQRAVTHACISCPPSGWLRVSDRSDAAGGAWLTPPV